jgi:hypothetical protein
VLLLLLLTVFGLYGLSSGWFSGGTTADTQSAAASPTTAVMAAFEAGETPSATSTIEVPEAAATATPPPSLTAVIQETSTAAATDTPVVTETLAATESPTPTATEVVPTSSATSESTETVTATATSAPTATHSPTPAATSEPVPMTVIAQQAFLRDGPGINYRILDFPGQGTAVTVIARNGDANWYNVLLADGSRGWLHKDVLEPEDEGAFDGITVAATIPVPLDDFYDPILTPSGDSISVQVYHTYVGTQGENAQFQARLLPETDLVQPTYLSGRDLGIGLLIVAFNRVAEGEYTSSQVELCMVSETGNPFYCETVPVRKSW